MTAISQLPEKESEVLEIRLPAPDSSLFSWRKPLFWIWFALLLVGILDSVIHREPMRAVIPISILLPQFISTHFLHRASARFDDEKFSYEVSEFGCRQNFSMLLNEIGSAETDAKKRRLVLFSKSSAQRITIPLGREEPFLQLLRKIEELQIPLTETKRAAYLMTK